MLDRLDPDLQRSVFTHSSWTTRRSESYERLAFLGDSVLGLAVTTHLFPRLDAERFGPDFQQHLRRTGFLLPRFRQP